MRIKRFTLTVFAAALYGGVFAQGGGGAPNGVIDGLGEMVERREYMIPMKDGVHLATDVYRPVLQDDLAFENLSINLPTGPVVIPRLKIANRGLQYMQYPGQANPFQLPLLFTRTPYGKESPEQGQVEAIMGYAGVIQDLRGRYHSEGVYFPMYSDSWAKSPYIGNIAHPLDTTKTHEANEHEDGYETLQYLTNQLRYDANGDSIIDANDPLLSNGSIGMFGASALGNTQYQAAAVKKVDTDQPGLKCLLPVVASCEFYHSTGTQNGVYRERIIDGWLRGQVEFYGEYKDPATDNSVYNNIQSLGDYGAGVLYPKQAAEKAIDFWTTLNHAHYPDPPFRATMDVSHAPLNEQGEPDPNGTVSRYTNLDLPIYNLSGWWDIFVDGQLQTWQNLRKYGKKHRNEQKLVIGPWAHQTIGARTTGDMRQVPGGNDYRYPENVGSVIGVPLDNLSATNIGGISKSEVIDWYREYLGSPKVVFPPLNEWQFLSTVFGSNIYVKVPADTFIIPFEDFFNFINGTGSLKDLPVSFKGIGVADSNAINKITIPATGQSLIGDNSGAQLQPSGSTEWDSSKPGGVPPVRFYVVGPVNDGVPGNEKAGNYWHAADTFPLPNLAKQKLFLHADGSCTDQAPAAHEGALSYISDPNNPVITHGGPNMIEETPDIPGVEQRLSQGQMNLADPLYTVFTNDRPKIAFNGDSLSDVLRFVSPVLADTFSIAGTPVATIFAKSAPQSTVMADSTNCDFVIRVADVYPDGREMYVFEGAVNARAREYAKSWADGLEDPTRPWSNIKSNEIYEYRFRMLPIAYTFGKGHKVKILISSSNYPRYQACANIPLKAGEFYRRRPYEDKSYDYNGVTLYPRTALQTLEFSDAYSANIEFQYMGKPFSAAVGRDEALRAPHTRVAMYPNPAQDVVSFAAEKNGPYTLTVFNATGQEVARARFENVYSLDVSAFPRGLYSVQISDAKNQPVTAKKLILR